MKSELIKQEREIVIPGEVIATGLDFLPGNGCYRESDEIKSKLLGLVRKKDRMLGIIPLAGVYNPKVGDGIIAKIIEVQNKIWIADINSPYQAILPLSDAVREFVDINRVDIKNYFDVGDLIYTKVNNVSNSKSIALSMTQPRTRKLFGGRIMKFTPAKVPRLIGKGGSMIELIKENTKCNIVVGQNGVIWLKGENEALAIKCIETIEEESHIKGLTNKITKMVGAEVGKKPTHVPEKEFVRGEINE